MKASTRRAAFTLVELLVVIGIIALLISILLPSLNKARQFANNIKCSSNQRQIGQLIAMYAAQNNGYLPAASSVFVKPVWANPGPNPGGPNPDQYGNSWAQNHPTAFWFDTLSVFANRVTMGSKLGTTGSGTGAYFRYTNLGNAQNMAYDVLPIFHDTDTPDLEWRPRATSYMVNMRVIAPINCRDRAYNGGGAGADGKIIFHRQRSQGDIKRAGDVMAMFCGALFTAEGFNDISKYDMASWVLDYYAYGSHGYAYNKPAFGSADVYDKRIGLGANASGYSAGAPVTLTQLKADNTDISTGTGVAGAGAGMRFRHLNNSSVNALFADGHVESRGLGDVYARDICLNVK